MASDGQVVFEVVGDTSKVEQSVKNVTETIKTESKKWDNETKNSFKKMEDSGKESESVLQGVFAGVAAGVTSAIINATGQMISAFVDWAAASIDVAANLEQIQGVVDVTFGETGAQKIEKWADTAGRRFGYTRLEAMKLSSSMGILLKASGISANEAADMSTNLAGLAADMGAFLDMDADKAFEKIKSAMEGNASALKDLGVQMKGADFDGFYESLGMEGKFSDLSLAEQYAVRYQYIIDKMSDINGQYAREAKSTLEGTQDQITVLTDRLQENVGENLLPISKKAQEFKLSLLQMLTGDPDLGYEYMQKAITIRTALDYFKSVLSGGTGTSGGTSFGATQGELTQWLADENKNLESARTELDGIAEKYAEIFDMENGVFDSDTFSSFGEYFYDWLQHAQPFASGEERNQIDSILSEMEAAHSKIGESEKAVAAFQEQLNDILSDMPDTTANGAAVVSDLVTGMDSQVGSVQAEVDLINGILSDLGNTGTGVPGAIPQHEAGLNYVPFDGYLASLHEGEGILTAEENRIWQRFRNGQPGNIDYDALGGVMRDNVKAGGNVYLDGRTVGQVVSDIQGRSYKTLQRSGWQG